jgi:hypothetical protein
MTHFVDEYQFPMDATYRAIVSVDAKSEERFRVVGTFVDGGLLAAINDDGTSAWQKVYIADGHTLRFISGVRCDNGDLMLHGSLSTATPDFNESMIVRVAPDGQLRWAKSFTRDKTRLNIRLAKG